ncbi:RNA recognition motif domain-containing protein [Rhizoctonia solani AG-1 IA]|uniref:RNA recognition motif domain-containing protein n=1 Tax=Thanatephorus cucumeris (strain AG1-IA) TaxID=983506 RepID=L8X1W3_THACA|nr:RNA recognition motif domain-containing protein [Rhizoctonia solani AG-1 IA]
MIPTKKDIAFVEFVDEATSTVAKEALHNYKLDGENKIKVGLQTNHGGLTLTHAGVDHVRKEMTYVCAYSNKGYSSAVLDSSGVAIMNYVAPHIGIHVFWR